MTKVISSLNSRTRFESRPGLKPGPPRWEAITLAKSYFTRYIDVSSKPLHGSPSACVHLNSNSDLASIAYCIRSDSLLHDTWTSLGCSQNSTDPGFYLLCRLDDTWTSLGCSPNSTEPGFYLLCRLELVPPPPPITAIMTTSVSSFLVFFLCSR